MLPNYWACRRAGKGLFPRTRGNGFPLTTPKLLLSPVPMIQDIIPYFHWDDRKPRCCWF